jgi:mannosyltransferase
MNPRLPGRLSGLVPRAARRALKQRLGPFPLWVILLSLASPLALEALWHQRAFSIPLPPPDPTQLDGPFFTACQDPGVTGTGAGPRENAVLVMLARNSELRGANHSVASIERRFNRWFHYPYVFLNDEPWDPAFVETLSAAASGEARFEVIPPEEWTFPQWIDADAARASMAAQERSGVKHGGQEGYHNMCRFFSG